MKNFGQFHDGFFDGLRIPEKGTVEIYLSTLSGERATFTLTDVVMLNATGFKERNLVFDVTIRHGEEISLRDIADLYDLQPERQSAKWETQLLEKAIREDFHFFEISPSYGASCLALSRAVDFRKDD